MALCNLEKRAVFEPFCPLWGTSGGRGREFRFISLTTRQLFPVDGQPKPETFDSFIGKFSLKIHCLLVRASSSSSSHGKKGSFKVVFLPPLPADGGTGPTKRHTLSPSPTALGGVRRVMLIKT